MAPAAIRCCVPGCRTVKGQMPLYCLPRTDALRALWLSYLSPFCPHLSTLSTQQLRNKYVCNKHFEARFIHGERRVLVSWPTLFSEEEISAGVAARHLHVQQPEHDYVKHLADHSYASKIKLAGDLQNEHAYLSSFNGKQKENEEPTQKSAKMHAVTPTTASKSQELHGVELRWDTEVALGPQKATDTAELHGVELRWDTEVALGPQKATDTAELHGVELRWDTEVALGPQEATDTAGDTFVDAMKFDEIEISPLPSPLREDSPTPPELEPNKGHVIDVFSHKTTSGPRVVSPAPYRMNKPNSEHASDVFSHKTTPGPRLVSPVPYRMNKPNSDPVNQPVKNQRLRIMQRYSNLSTCCQTLYDKCKATIVKLRRQLKAAKYSATTRANSKTFESVTNTMPLPIRTFVRMQADIIRKKNRQAHRFKEDQKLLCLALYTANPAAYKFMSTIFMLPHKKTLIKFGLDIKDQADKAAKPAEQTDATETTQESVTPIQTPVAVPERGCDMPIFDDTEIPDAVAAIAPPTPTSTEPALPAPTTASNPAHAELIAELKRCLPAAPKLPAAGAVLTDEHGRFVRRFKRPQKKINPSLFKKPQQRQDVIIRVFKLADGTTCEDVAAHVSAIVPNHLVRCRKVLTKMKGPAFVLEVPKEHRESILDPAFWPEGVVTWARGKGFPMPEKMLKIRVFNIAEGTPVSEMVQHICQVVPEDKMTCEKLESKERGDTFKIAMPKRYLRIVAAPSFWPTGVGVARMRTQLNPRKKRDKKKNSTDLDQVKDIASKRMKHGGKFRPSAYINS